MFIIALLFCFLCFLAILLWLLLRSRVAKLESAIWKLNEKDLASAELQILELTGRVYQLEQELATLRTGAVIPEPFTEQAAPEQSIIEEPVPQETELREEVIAPPIPVVVPPLPQIVELPQPQATFAEKLREKVGDEGWEALVGGSILNKLGALVLVVGIALFLAYSFTYMAPAGRAAIAATLSAVLLAAGIWCERRPKYKLFSWGLTGAGWAGLYATAYAMYALPAAQIITDPLIGSILLLIVAAGMIAYSLRYRIQTVTSVAFFTAFAALGVTPATSFGVVGLIPLAGALLYLAWRFEWYGMALFGLVATWGTCISHGSSGASLKSVETLLLVYWAMFEAFDLLRIRRHVKRGELNFLLPLNAIAFLGLSYDAWWTQAPHDLWQMSTLASALYLGSTLFRARFHGRYQTSLTLSAVLAGLAIFGRADGLWASVGLAAEAELLYLAGVRFRLTFLRTLGSIAFSISLASVFGNDQHGKQQTLLGFALHRQTPPVLLHAFLFYLNRVLWKPNLRFSFTGSGLITLVLLAEVPSDYAGLSLLPLALILLEIGIRQELLEFRIQSYAVGVIAAFTVLITHWASFQQNPVLAVWLSFLGVATGCWVMTTRAIQLASLANYPKELRIARDASALVGTAFAMATLWMLLPQHMIALTWMGLALLWIELGFRLQIPSLTWIGNGTALVAVGRAFGVHIWETERSPWWPTGVPMLGALYYVWYRFKTKVEKDGSLVATGYAWLAAVLAATLIGTELDQYGVAAGWAILTLAFLTLGLWKQIADFRIQSYFGVLLVCVQCLTVDFTDADPANRLFRLSSTGIAVAILFAAQFLIRHYGDGLSGKTNWERHAKTFFSITAVWLLSALLYHEVSGSLLTVAWGLQGVLLLSVGLSARERVLRLEGLALLLSCILKLFVYDLRNLETLYRILSFLALGVILIGVSWIYTRFRERLRQYL